MVLGVLSLLNPGMQYASISSAVIVAMSSMCAREVFEFSGVPVGATIFPVPPTASINALITVGGPPSTSPMELTEA